MPTELEWHKGGAGNSPLDYASKLWTVLRVLCESHCNCLQSCDKRAKILWRTPVQDNCISFKSDEVPCSYRRRLDQVSTEAFLFLNSLPIVLPSTSETFIRCSCTRSLRRCITTEFSKSAFPTTQNFYLVLKLTLTSQFSSQIGITKKL